MDTQRAADERKERVRLRYPAPSVKSRSSLGLPLEVAPSFHAR